MTPAFIPLSASRALVHELIGGDPDTWDALMQSTTEPLPPECVIRIKRRQKAEPLVHVDDLYMFAEHMQAITDSQPDATAGKSCRTRSRNNTNDPASY